MYVLNNSFIHYEKISIGKLIHKKERWVSRYRSTILCKVGVYRDLCNQTVKFEFNGIKSISLDIKNNSKRRRSVNVFS
jgi:hypothetical protein